MRVHGLTQSTETRELTAEADDAQAARAGVEEQLPEGFELLRVHNSMPRGGRVIATAVIREATTRRLDAEGPDYAAARDALHAMIPEGHRLLSITIDDD